jgi:predicted nucleotide-binding protein (sugar kinase/HSP70/actin superfamily)
MELYTEILKADRTAMSLMEQGFVRSHVQYCMPILIEHGLIYKYGSGKKTYYSANKYEEAASKAARKKADPIVLPEGIKGNAALALRMGYTDIEPVGGRLFKGALSVEP